MRTKLLSETQIELTKDTDYFDFKSFVYQNIKDTYKDFINTQYFDRNHYTIEGKRSYQESEHRVMD